MTFGHDAGAVSSPGQPVAEGDPVNTEIGRLNDDRFQVREEATRKLWELGQLAVPKLKEAIRGSDPEVAKRATTVLRKIDLGITPETPEAVVALVERYGRSNIDDKQRILRELRQQKAWRQILKLYALETDADVRSKTRADIEFVAIIAARESIVAGNAQDALGFLQMTPDDSSGLMPLADFHRANGTLKDELAKSMAAADGKPHWRLALHRAAGDLKAARADAVESRELRIESVIDMMEGDPFPFMRSSPAGEDAPSLRQIYIQLAEKHWRGEPLAARDFDALQPFMRGSGDESNRWTACGIYFLLGDGSTAELMFSKLSPMSAFRHYDLLERIPDALKVIGIDPEKPDYAAWVAKRFRAVLDQPDDSDQERLDLINLALFMERRGLRKELEAFDPFLAKLSTDDSEVFMQFLSSLFGHEESGTGAVSLARRVSVAYAGEDDGKWSEIIDNVFGDGNEIDKWWTWMAALDPAAKRAARFDGLLALMRLGNDPANLRSRWLKLAWDAIETLPKADVTEKIAMMATLATQSGDLSTGLKAWDQMREEIPVEDEEDDGSERGIHLLYLSAAGRWQDAADLWLKLVKKNPERPEFHAYAAACLRRAGKDEEAAGQDAWADKLVLGDAGTCVRIGQAYSYGGDFKRAAQWWERALIQGDPDDQAWQVALSLHGTERTEAGDWRRSAAVNEVLAFKSYDNTSELPIKKLRLRVAADFPRALSQLDTARAKSIALLEKCHALLAADGSLADYFFPSLRKAGLIEEQNAWFEKSWQILKPVIESYPEGENARNTAAWLAARSLMRLDEAEIQVNRALKSSPDQAAYLDTKAEIAFARHDRKRALELSRQSLESSPLDEALRHQFERYRTGPFP
jgi:tetratricopeptide (TPR) repeat protein